MASVYLSLGHFLITIWIDQVQPVTPPVSRQHLISACVFDTNYRPSSDNSCTWKYIQARYSCRPRIAGFLYYARPIATSCNVHIQRLHAGEDPLPHGWRCFHERQHLHLVQLRRRQPGLPQRLTCSRAKGDTGMISMSSRRRSRTDGHTYMEMLACSLVI